MQSCFGPIPILGVWCIALGAPGAPIMPSAAQSTPNTQLPASDARAAAPPKTLDTHRTFPSVTTLAEWEARRYELRTQILVSCGLYPLPAKTPLKPKIFGKVERDGYSIEKVYIQTYPGFYLAGNLYRPSVPSGGKRRPGILIAHGHWAVGRMADTADGSIPARAITFAREGYVAFSYDMVGYNDTHQVNHRFAGDAEHWFGVFP